MEEAERHTRQQKLESVRGRQGEEHAPSQCAAQLRAAPQDQTQGEESQRLGEPAPPIDRLNSVYYRRLPHEGAAVSATPYHPPHLDVVTPLDRAQEFGGIELREATGRPEV